MNRGSEARQELLKSTVNVVAKQGIQNATTKALSIESNLGEVYIYRHFNNKDDLFKETFDSLDRELMHMMLQSLKANESKNADVQTGFKSIFHDFWNFCLSDRNKCSFFIQYYYSSYYAGHSEAERKQIYQPFLDAIAPYFQEHTDCWMELNHMYDIVFSKLLRVIRGTMPDNAITEEAVYRDIKFVADQHILCTMNNDLTR